MNSYISTKTGFDERGDRYGAFVSFKDEVEVTESKLNVGTVTLLTRIGGIIGVGKEFLWIVITVSSFIMILYTKCIK